MVREGMAWGEKGRREGKERGVSKKEWGREGREESRYINKAKSRGKKNETRDGHQGWVCRRG